MFNTRPILNTNKLQYIRIFNLFYIALKRKKLYKSYFCFYKVIFKKLKLFKCNFPYIYFGFFINLSLLNFLEKIKIKANFFYFNKIHLRKINIKNFDAFFLKKKHSLLFFIFFDFFINKVFCKINKLKFSLNNYILYLILNQKYFYFWTKLNKKYLSLILDFLLVFFKKDLILQKIENYFFLLFFFISFLYSIFYNKKKIILKKLKLVFFFKNIFLTFFKNFLENSDSLFDFFKIKINKFYSISLLLRVLNYFNFFKIVKQKKIDFKNKSIVFLFFFKVKFLKKNIFFISAQKVQFLFLKKCAYVYYGNLFFIYKSIKNKFNFLINSEIKTNFLKNSSNIFFKISSKKTIKIYFNYLYYYGVNCIKDFFRIFFNSHCFKKKGNYLNKYLELNCIFLYFFLFFSKTKFNFCHYYDFRGRIYCSDYFSIFFIKLNRLSFNYLFYEKNIININLILLKNFVFLKIKKYYFFVKIFFSKINNIIYHNFFFLLLDFSKLFKGFLINYFGGKIPTSVFILISCLFLFKYLIQQRFKCLKTKFIYYANNGLFFTYSAFYLKLFSYFQRLIKKRKYINIFYKKINFLILLNQLTSHMCFRIENSNVLKDSPSSVMQHIVKIFNYKNVTSLSGLNLNNNNFYFDSYSFIIYNFFKTFFFKKNIFLLSSRILTRSSLKRIIMAHYYSLKFFSARIYFLNYLRSIKWSRYNKKKKFFTLKKSMYIFKKFYVYLNNFCCLNYFYKNNYKNFKKINLNFIFFEKKTKINLNYYRHSYIKKNVKLSNFKKSNERVYFYEINLLKKADILKKKNSIFANIIHSVDSYFLRVLFYYIKFYKFKKIFKKISYVSTIHDCFFIPLNLVFIYLYLLNICFWQSFPKNFREINSFNFFSLYVVL